MTTYPCLRCDEPYEQGNRRASHFCPVCRVERARENEAARKRRIRSIARDVRTDLDTYRHSYEREHDMDDTIEAIMGMDIDRAFATIAEYADTVDEGEPWALLPDRPLAGATSPAGPSIGWSTYFPDLAAELYGRPPDWRIKGDDGYEGLAGKAVSNPWWDAEPHWSHELNDPVKAREYLNLGHLQAA